jgi:TonB family protein
MFRRLFLITAMAIFAAHADSAGPQRFYMVSVAFSNGPSFDYRILDVRQRGTDSVIRYIRIAPRKTSCAMKFVQAVEASIPNTTPAQLLEKNNPCGVHPGTLEAAIKKYSHRAHASETTTLGVVAQCDSGSVSLMLPTVASVKWKKLKTAHPDVAHLWDLPAELIDRAFGSKEVFNERDEEEDLALQRVAEKFIPELIAGQYDTGLAAAVKAARYGWPHPRFKDLLWDYHGPVAISQSNDNAQLLNPDRYHFSTFLAPQYPPLAKAARIQGTVTLRLTVNQATGEVSAATLLSGHPLLKDSAITAAKQWRFTLNFPTPETVDVSLDYVLRCLVLMQPCDASRNRRDTHATMAACFPR